MKLIHASIPADNPKVAATVLAQMFDGEALPFPPGGPDSWIAWAGDSGLSLEIVPRGHLVHMGDDEAEWRPSERQSLSEVHLAIGVNRPHQEILDLAAAAGWPARPCSRGNGLFDLIEVWVEGSFLLELFDPQQAATYEQRVTLEGWKEYVERAA